MDVTVINDPATEKLEIIFYKFPYEFKIPEGEYPFISKLYIFGINKRPKRIYYTNKKENNDIPEKLVTMNNETKALYVSDLRLPLESESTYKLIVEMPK
jgi:hypothetical protein